MVSKIQKALSLTQLGGEGRRVYSGLQYPTIGAAWGGAGGSVGVAGLGEIRMGLGQMIGEG